MLVLMLFSGVGGWFLYYAMLRGLALGKVDKTLLFWTRCVLAPALMLAGAASVAVRYFFPETTIWVTMALWPIFVLALDPGYRLATLGRDGA